MLAYAYSWLYTRYFFCTVENFHDDYLKSIFVAIDLDSTSYIWSSFPSASRSVVQCRQFPERGVQPGPEDELEGHQQQEQR